MGDLSNRVIKTIEEKRDRLLNGNINSIPSPFERFSDDFLGIEQGKYYVTTGSTKSAKTQLSTYIFVYHTLLYAYYNPSQVRVKIFYYPLEETPEDIITKFMSFLLYVQSKYTIRVSPTDLNSVKSGKILSQDIIDILRSEEYQKIINFFEDNVIFSSSTNPTGVYNECVKYAKTHGTVHTKKQKIKNDSGEIIEIDAFDWYEQNDPNEYRIIFYDHISLTSTERGLTLKQSIDKLSEYFVLLRNRYKYSPVVVQQQSFENESLENIKMNKLRPTIAGLADSKYCSRDSNIVLGIFSPFKFELKEYFGYDITILRDNVRFLELLINRSGSPGGIVALYFDGAVNYFKELPKPTDVEIQRVYNNCKKKNNCFYLKSNNHGKRMFNFGKKWSR